MSNSLSSLVRSSAAAAGAAVILSGCTGVPEGRFDSQTLRGLPPAMQRADLEALTSQYGNQLSTIQNNANQLGVHMATPVVNEVLRDDVSTALAAYVADQRQFGIVGRRHAQDAANNFQELADESTIIVLGDTPYTVSGELGHRATIESGNQYFHLINPALQSLQGGDGMFATYYDIQVVDTANGQEPNVFGVLALANTREGTYLNIGQSTDKAFSSWIRTRVETETTISASDEPIVNRDASHSVGLYGTVGVGLINLATTQNPFAAAGAAGVTLLQTEPYGNDRDPFMYEISSQGFADSTAYTIHGINTVAGMTRRNGHPVDSIYTMQIGDAQVYLFANSASSFGNIDGDSVVIRANNSETDLDIAVIGYGLPESSSSSGGNSSNSGGSFGNSGSQGVRP